MQVDIGLQEHQCKEVVALLNALLADEYVLYTKTLNFHWNVYGCDFKPLHVFFQEQYEQIFEIIDDVAERVKALGGDAFGSMKQFLGATRLKEESAKIPTDCEMVRMLLMDHEAIICTLRENIETCAKIGDMGTNNFLTDIMEKHEKMAWMLRATVQK